MQWLLPLMPRLVSGVLCSRGCVFAPCAFSFPAVSCRPVERRLFSSVSFLQNSDSAASAFSIYAFPRLSLPNLPATTHTSKAHRRRFFEQAWPPRYRTSEQISHRLGDPEKFLRSSSVLQRPVLRCAALSSLVPFPSVHRLPAGSSLMSVPSCAAKMGGPNRTVTSGPSKAASVAAASELSPAEKVAALRQLMRQHQVDAYIIFSADAHGSEVPAPCDGRREFLTNFDGTSGVAVVTLQEALLWTDGRYFVQAEQQLDLSVWKLMKQNTPGYPKLHAWLAANHEVFRVAVHGWSTPAAEYTQLLQAGFLPSAPLMQTAFPAAKMAGSFIAAAAPAAPPPAAAAAGSAAAAAAPASSPALVTDGERQQQQQPLRGQERKKEVVIYEENFVDQIWGSLRPTRNLEPLAVHPLKYAGETTEKKLQRIAAQMRAADADILLLSALDDVAWLLNLRGSDIPWSRVFYGYCLIVRQPQAQQQQSPSAAAAAGRQEEAKDRQQQQQQETDKEEGEAAAGAAAQSPLPLLLFYVDEGRVTGPVAEQLAAAHVSVRSYSNIARDLRLLLSDSAAFYAATLQQKQSPAFSAFCSSGAEPACAAGADVNSCIPAPIGGSGGSSCSSGSRLLLLLLQQQQQEASARGAGAAGQAAAATKAATGPQSRMVWMDPAVNVALYVAAHEGHTRVMLRYTPAAQLKAVKNAAELEGMKEGHILDGVVLCKFFLWLEQHQQHKKAALDEWTAAKVVDTFRSVAPHSQGSSFPTIASVDANAAVVHYSTTDLARIYDPDGLLVVTHTSTYLCNGGFYGVGCTTDVTRTVHTAQPPDEQRRWFTLVLKGFIALSRQSFPQGTRGPQLDALARQHLWACGVDYRHGTGHGVGSLLNVHEGPIGISPRLLSQAAEAELDEGNVLSIEPGYYVQDAFGIRIENLAFVKRAPSGETFKDTKFFQFEQLTMVPIQKKFIIPSLLTKEELEWLNNYHAQVWEKLSPRLKEEAGACTKQLSVRVEGVEGFCVNVPSAEETLRWLRAATEPLVAN